MSHIFFAIFLVIIHLPYSTRFSSCIVLSDYYLLFWHNKCIFSIFVKIQKEYGKEVCSFLLLWKGLTHTIDTHIIHELANYFLYQKGFVITWCCFSFSSHIAAECTSITTCWNCKEPGHLANQCNNDPVCHMCGKMGHLARDCSGQGLPAHDPRLCNNCYRPGHIAADCTNEKACNNCRKTGHLARDCPNDPVCNICNISGHVARQCLKSTLVPEMIGGPFRDVLCRNCGHAGHISRDCVSIVICNNCGGRGHQAFECPSARMFDHSLRRFWSTLVCNLNLILVLFVRTSLTICWL